jgi:tetratricopeptide (TPR) repeat protein
MAASCQGQRARGYAQAVSPRARVGIVVAALAVASAGAVVGIVAAQTSGDEAGAAPAATTAAERPEGAPPLVLELGFRRDPEARDLQRAAGLYRAGRLREAGAIFDRHRSLEAKVGSAFATWPADTVKLMGRLAALNPRSALVQVNLGLARVWAGEAGADDAWREAQAVEPDTPYAITAGDLLHPGFARGLPTFVPSFEVPASITELPPARQLGALERAAGGGVHERLLYGVGLQRVGRPVSAARAFAAAAHVAPQDVEAQVAAAVGRFDKARPAEAFSRLGPLTRRFPKAATVRFHLGLLLLWSGQVEEAKRQLRLAERVEPGSPLASEAKRYLERIGEAEAR